MAKEIYEFNPDDAYRFAHEQGIPAHKSNGQLHFHHCPYCHGGQHNHDKNTFAIDLKTGQFNCKRSSCGVKGNMLTLAKDFNFSLGTNVDEYLHQRKSFKRLPPGKPTTKPAAVKFLESRGISKETAEKYNIGLKKGDSSVLLFPFYDENDVLTMIKYRQINFDKSKGGSKEWAEAGCKPILFGMNHCNFDNKTLIMTEGQLDSLSLSEVGIENAVSVPNGAKGFTWVPYCWNFLVKFDELIVFGDHENGHITLLDEMKSQFRGRIKHVREDDYKDCKDANDILRKYGKDALRQAVEQAVPIDNPRIIRMADVQDVDLLEKEQFLSGFKWLDRILGGFYFGQLVVVTGERGKGKSTLVSQLATFVVSAGYKVLFYSGEMDDTQVKKWFMQQAAGNRNIIKVEDENRGWFYQVNKDVSPQIVQWFEDKVMLYNNKFVSEEEEEENLLTTLECAIQQYGCRVLIVDNLMSAITDDMEADMNRQQTAFVKKLALLSKQYDALIFLIAHPRKGDEGRITNDSIAGSGNITNLADVVIQYGSIPKDKVADAEDVMNRNLTVLKNRLTGRTDFDGITLYFDEPSKRISESEGQFDWEIGWESTDDFDPVFDMEIPFD